MSMGALPAMRSTGSASKSGSGVFMGIFPR